MYSKFFQRLRHQACAVLFGIVLISACTVSAGAVVLLESGDGMALYGSEVVPDISSLDAYDLYPYAFMGYMGNDFGVIFTSNPLFVSDGSLILPPETSGSMYMFSGGSWTYVSGIPVISIEYTIVSLDALSFVWSNYSVLDSSDTVVYSSSDPFSLNGFNYFYWDGDKTDLPVWSGNVFSLMYRVSDFVISEQDFSESYTLSHYIYSGADEYIFSSCSPIFYPETYTMQSSRGNVGFVLSGGENLGHYTSERGMYFNGSIDAVKYFIYPSSSVFVDFSSTTLSASNPQYDYQSAEFDVSWSNLPVVPYPDNVQYFIQGRLNDGSAAQPPEIYLGSSSDPPASNVPVSFSFTNLQPETQYTATFEIVYNSSGSFRDFIPSGVTTTVSFTTLSDGSISEGDKAIINAIQNANKDNQQWTDSQFGSAVGDLPEDTSETDNLISGLDQQEEAYKDDAYDRFHELSSAFSGFDGTVGSGIGLAGTLFSRFFNALGSYKIVYTFPLLLGLAMVLIGRLGRSSIRMEREPDDHS